MFFKLRGPCRRDQTASVDGEDEIQKGLTEAAGRGKRKSTILHPGHGNRVRESEGKRWGLLEIKASTPCTKRDGIPRTTLGKKIEETAKPRTGH